MVKREYFKEILAGYAHSIVNLPSFFVFEKKSKFFQETPNFVPFGEFFLFPWNSSTNLLKYGKTELKFKNVQFAETSNWQVHVKISTQRLK